MSTGVYPTLRATPSAQVSPVVQSQCATCGSRAHYARDLDRYLHEDASDNGPCWVALLRGERIHHGDRLQSDIARTPRKEAR